MFRTRQTSVAAVLLLTVGSAQVTHADPALQQANTESSSARSKWVTVGTVTGLTVVSLISSATFNALTGSDAGGCIFGDVTYDSGCKNQYKKEAVGFLVAGSVLGVVALGIGFGWRTSKPAPKPVVVLPPKLPVSPPRDLPTDPHLLPPPPLPPDQDQDGVAVQKDLCPRAAGRESDPKRSGCPLPDISDAIEQVNDLFIIRTNRIRFSADWNTVDESDDSSLRTIRRLAQHLATKDATEWQALSYVYDSGKVKLTLRRRSQEQAGAVLTALKKQNPNLKFSTRVVGQGNAVSIALGNTEDNHIVFCSREPCL